MGAFEILAIVVLFNVVATIELWRRAARRPEKLKRNFRSRFWNYKPITPRHQAPPALKVGYAVGKEELEFFSDFQDFANVVNWWLANSDINPDSPWRLQELPKSELSALAPDSPSYGRRYAIFHNQVRVGEIEITTGLKYSTENPEVMVHIELNWVRLLHYERIQSFLANIALHVTEYHPGTLGYLQTNLQIHRAIISVLWQTQEISQYGFENDPGSGEIELQLNGLATFYLARRRAWQNQPEKAGR